VNIVTIPLSAVSTRAFISWQCGGQAGMTLNRLAETCGCFSHTQENYGCHHPSGIGACIAHECPVAYIDYPRGMTEEEENRYSEGYGDEVRMELASKTDRDKARNFGRHGKRRKLWSRESRFADSMVERLLEGKPALMTVKKTRLIVVTSYRPRLRVRRMLFSELVAEYANDIKRGELALLQHDLRQPFQTVLIGGRRKPLARLHLVGLQVQSQKMEG
jgi:hypothetical protein